KYATIRGRSATSIGSPTPCSTALARSGSWSTIDLNKSTHICRRLELLVSARAGGAQQIAAIGDFQVDADRRVGGRLGALALDRFVVAARIDACVNNRIAAANTHYDRPVPAAFFR